MFALITPEETIKKLILPDALKYWKQQRRGSTKMAEVFRFWRTRYFIGIILVGFFTLRFPLVTFSWIIICCLLDYVIVRSRAKNRFNVQLKKLKEILNTDFYDWDLKRKDVYSIFVGEEKIKKYSPVHMLRKRWISDIAGKWFNSSFRILDVGCKDGQTALPVLKLEASVVGVDLNRNDLHNFNRRLNSPSVQANILYMPFGRNNFDAILFMEVMEHLFNPFQGLKEVARVLKPGGKLVLSTDNRHHIKLLDIINPLIILERILGFVYPGVLAPKNLLYEDGPSCRFYHTSFSRTEIISIIKEANLEIVSCFSYFYLPGVNELLGKLNPQMTQNDYCRYLYPLEKILARIPLIRWFGGHWMMILKKPIYTNKP